MSNLHDGAEGEGGEGESEQRDEAEDFVLPLAAMEGGGDSGGDGEDQAEDQCGDGQFNGVGIAGGDQVED